MGFFFFKQKTAYEMRISDWSSDVCFSDLYLALLAEYPETLARVARIVGASSWAAHYLSQYPLLLDSLIEWRSLLEPADFHQIGQQLRSELSACLLPDGQPDLEQQTNLLRDKNGNASSREREVPEV